MEIVLGSSSPRREGILKSIYPDITISPPSIIEEQLPDEVPETFARRISHEKALDVLKSLNKNSNEKLLITADTVVAIGEKTLGKPRDYSDAKAMLKLLCGNKHKVISGLTLIHITTDQNIIKSGNEETTVTFKPLSEKEIDTYLSLIDYRDKAGSYACQEYGDIIIQQIDGSLSNVIGFPLRLYYRFLFDMGIVDKGI